MINEPADLAGKNSTVLLVDDDRAMVNSTTQWLTLSGLSVRSFADPVAVLKVINPKKLDVLVSDIKMPELDGIELLKQVLLKDPNLPVILITGHGDVPLAVEAMKLGAFEFLTKPFSPEKLLKLVKQAQALRIHQYKISNKEISKRTAEDDHKSDYSSDKGLSPQVEEFEKSLLEKVLKKHGGKIANVLVDLGIPRRTLNAKMKKYGLSSNAYRTK